MDRCQSSFPQRDRLIQEQYLTNRRRSRILRLAFVHSVCELFTDERVLARVPEPWSNPEVERPEIPPRDLGQ